jgi:opine dehydrogenase
MNEIAVLGAGHGGCAASCDLTKKGYSVNLFEGFDSNLLLPIKERGGIEYVGALGEGFAKLNKITSDIKEAIDGVDLIMVVVPSSGHEYHAKKIAPHLRENQLIFVVPGHTGGSLHFSAILKKEGVEADVNLCETNTLPYITRKETLDRVRIFSKDKNILFSVFPSKNFKTVYEKIQPLYSDLLPAENVLETGLMNDNALMHPPTMILNTGWVEHSKGDFAFYYDGFTPSVANVAEALETERLKTAKALGLKPTRFADWWATTGRTTRTESLYEAMRASEANKAIRAPDNMKHRFLEEDIDFGLVPMSYFAKIANVTIPATMSLIYLASMINKVDYMQQGLTPEKMGIENLDQQGLKNFVKEGKRCRKK